MTVETLKRGAVLFLLVALLSKFGKMQFKNLRSRFFWYLLLFLLITPVSLLFPGKSQVSIEVPQSMVQVMGIPEDNGLFSGTASNRADAARAVLTGAEITGAQMLLVEKPDTDSSILQILLWVYLIGAGIFTARQFIEIGYYHAKIRRLNPIADGRLLEIFEPLRREIVGDKKVKFIDGGKTMPIPVSFSFLGSAVIFPVADSAQLSDAEIKMIISHELAHLKRCDHVRAYIFAVAGALLWFNPFYFWISRQVALLRELRADKIVIEYQGGSFCAENYARLIFDYHMRFSRQYLTPILSFSCQRSMIGVRIMELLEHKKRWSMAMIFAMIAAVASAAAIPNGIEITQKPINSAITENAELITAAQTQKLLDTLTKYNHNSIGRLEALDAISRYLRYAMENKIALDINEDNPMWRSAVSIIKDTERPEELNFARSIAEFQKSESRYAKPLLEIKLINPSGTLSQKLLLICELSRYYSMYESHKLGLIGDADMQAAADRLYKVYDELAIVQPGMQMQSMNVSDTYAVVSCWELSESPGTYSWDVIFKSNDNKDKQPEMERYMSFIKGKESAFRVQENEFSVHIFDAFYGPDGVTCQVKVIANVADFGKVVAAGGGEEFKYGEYYRISPENCELPDGKVLMFSRQSVQKIDNVASLLQLPDSYVNVKGCAEQEITEIGGKIYASAPYIVIDLTVNGNGKMELSARPYLTANTKALYIGAPLNVEVSPEMGMQIYKSTDVDQLPAITISDFPVAGQSFTLDTDFALAIERKVLPEDRLGLTVAGVSRKEVENKHEVIYTYNGAVELSKDALPAKFAIYGKGTMRPLLSADSQ